MTDATLPTEEQRQRAKWDLLLLDIEHRTEQLRATRQEIHLKPWQVGFTGMTAGAALFAAGAAFMKLFGG